MARLRSMLALKRQWKLSFTESSAICRACSTRHHIWRMFVPPTLIIRRSFIIARSPGGVVLRSSSRLQTATEEDDGLLTWHSTASGQTAHPRAGLVGSGGFEVPGGGQDRPPLTRTSPGFHAV